MPVVVDTDTHAFLLDNPGIELDVDVSASTLYLPDGRSVEFPIDRFARYCLVEGIDQLGFLQKQLGAIETYEENRSWKP